MSFKHIAVILVILIFLPIAFAADDYKPYLHKASIPQAPKLKLLGQYATNLYPGAATYSFPIEVPKGTNNLQPSITISYNSQAVKQRPGMLSAGWSLTANDYIYRDINFTADTSDDYFILVLDGNTYKLIQNGDEYRTEVEYHFKIQKLSGAPNQLGSYWLLTARDGTKYRFGYDNDSELTSNTMNNTAAKWSVDRIEDTFGNTINYAYLENPNAEDAGAVYLQQITYNKDERRKIVFSYESSVRPDRRRAYEQGSIVEESRRLIDISIFVDNALVRRDNINYATLNPALSSISSIKQYGNDNSSLLSTVSFDYYNSEAGFAQTTSLWRPNVLFSDNSHVDYGVRLIDLNNDGYTDMIKGRGSTSEKQAWLNDKNGNWTASASYSTPEYIVTGTYGTDEGVRFEDVNNDGLIDLLKSKAGTRVVYLNNGTGWTSSSFSIPIDFVDSSGNDLGILIADVTGDGRADIIKAKSGMRAVYLNTGSGWTNSSWSVPVDFIDANGDTGARLVDINGDGLPDIIQATSKGTSVQKAWLNNGSGWTEYSNWQPPVYFVTSTKPDNGVRFSDVNGDGLIDILEDYANGTSTSKSAWINTGNGWSSDSSWQSPEAFTANDYNIARRIADVNGDGLPDVVVSHQDSSQQYVWLKNSTIPYLLKKITNEYGGTTSVNYTASTQFNNTENGVSKIGFNIFVVSSMFTNNSMSGAFGSTTAISYNYSLGKYNYGRYEFRGFGISIEIKPSSVVKHYFYQDDPRRGKEYETDVYDANNKLFSKSLKDFNFTQSTKGIYNVTLLFNSLASYDGSDNPKITNTTYVYDYDGNPLLISEQGDISVPGDERYTNYTYAYNTNSWILDRVASATVYDTNMQKVKETKYYYDGLGLQGVGSQGALTKKEEWNNNGENSFTYYDYDAFGNVIAQTDSLGNINKFVYEDSGTYPERAINALGYITQYNYDLGTGNLNWKESNNIKTEYAYDVFGRISKEILPYDTESLPTKSYSYSLDGIAPESISVSQKTSTDKTNVVRFFYDGNANLVQLKTDIENNTQIVKNIYYDGFGKVVSEDNPYFDNSSTLLSTPINSPKTNYSYDALDRVVLVKNPDETNKTVVFDKWNITDYDENGNKHLYEIDSFGRISKVHEFDSDPVAKVYGQEFVTNYEYDALDNLVKITDNENNIFSFTYDSLGRKTAMNDPDMGKWTYAYDQNGNLISQSGGSGNLITGDGFYREYNGDNQLIRVRNGSTSSSPILEEYTYDPYGQRVKITRHDSANTVIYTPFKEFMRVVNSSGTFDYTYIYDGDKIVARVNPDGTNWFFHNDHLGSATSITDQNGNVIENVSYAPFGEELTNSNSDIHGYTGQQNDELTNQMYYGARYYKPQNAQFTQPDSVIQNIFNPQDLNHYAYVRNNPYKAVDPDGRRVEYAVENVGGEDIIAIYVNGGYVGRVIDEVSNTINVKTLFGTNMDVTTYDYVVQPGSKSNVRGTLYVGAYDTSGDTELLSNIYDKDKKNLFRDENVELGLSIASDIYAGVKIAGKSSDILRGISTIDTGITMANAFNDPRNLVGLLPFMSTITTLATQDKGYQKGQQIPEFKKVRKNGGITYGSYGDSTFSIETSGGKTEIIVVTKVK